MGEFFLKFPEIWSILHFPYYSRHMKVWTRWLAASLAFLTLACDASQSDSVVSQPSPQDSVFQAAQLVAWRRYAEDMYYYRREPRSTFAPVSARDPQPPGPPSDFTGTPQSEGPAPAAIVSDEPAFPVGSIVLEANQIKVQTSRPLVFARSSASLLPSQMILIDEMVQLLRQESNRYRYSVVGFAMTDEWKENAQWQDQWHLSSARATVVVRELINRGISPYRLEAVGRGSFVAQIDSMQSQVEVVLVPVPDRP